jgi:hypothetical protein
VSERTVNGPQFYLSLPANGQYQLAARARNAHGLEGYDSSKTFQLKAYPRPLAAGNRRPAGNPRPDPQPEHHGQPGATGTMAAIAPAGFQPDQPNPAADHPAEQADLPEDGQWYWRVAHLDAQGQPGPYSETQSVLAKGLFSSLNPAVPVLLARHYPVKDARYTLTLLAQADRQTVIYRNTAQPAWPLSQLPKGSFWHGWKSMVRRAITPLRPTKSIQLH